MLIELQHRDSASTGNDTPFKGDIFFAIRGGAASRFPWSDCMSPLGSCQLHEANARHVEEVLEVDAVAIIVLSHVHIIHGGRIVEVHGIRRLVIDVFETTLAFWRRCLVWRGCCCRSNDI